jgi:hypothetical protein
MDDLLRFPCLACGKRLKASREHAGRTARCSCGQAVVVPDPEPLRFTDSAAFHRPSPTRRKDLARIGQSDEFFQVGAITGAVVGGVAGFLISFIPKDEFRPISLLLIGGVIGYGSLGLFAEYVIHPLYWRIFHGSN